MGSSQSVQSYRPGVDRPAKTYEEVYEEMRQQKEQKASNTRSKVTGTLRVASRLGRNFMSENSFGSEMSLDNEVTPAGSSNKQGTYVPDNLMEMRQNVDYMRQNGQKVKTLGYTDAQIGTMSDLDKQKVISSGFAANPNGHNVQDFLAKSAAYNITEKIMPQAAVVAPVIKKVKQLAPKKLSTYMEDDFGMNHDNTDYGLVSENVDYTKSAPEGGPLAAPEPEDVREPYISPNAPDAGATASTGYDRNAALDALTANIKQREMETDFGFGGKYF